ncbi:MAG: AsmA family protein, partial [Proteobacteria bacterium]|nr:AsmA family protein [Pseudomonadota bacterium]
MRWRRIALWSGLGLLALIVLAISWLWTADLGTFKPHIERWASEKTGRQISIDGDLHIDLARHSVVIAENIRIQNAAWSEPADMITVGRIEVRLDLRSIFNGPILIELIDLDDAEIFLTRPPDGDPNWMLKEPQEKEEKSSDELEILFRQIDIARVHLVYTSPERTEPIDLFVEHFEQKHGDDDFLELSLAATVGDRQVKLEGKIGTWAALLRGEDVQYDFAAQLDTFEIVSTGRIDDLTKPRRPSLNFTARGPDIDDLTRLLKMGQEGSGDINLSGSLRPVQQGPLVLDIKGNIGRTEIEASGTFSDLQDLEDIDINLLASGPDIRPILNFFGIDQVRESPFMVNVDAQRRGKSLIVEKAEVLFGEAQFKLTARMPKFPSIDDSVIKLQIDGPDIERFRYVFGLPGEATGAFSVDFIVDVADDGVEVLNLDIQTSLGRLEANGKLGQAPDYFGSTLKFQLNSDSLARSGSAYGLRMLPDQPIEIIGSAEWTKDGIRTVDSLQLT